MENNLEYIDDYFKGDPLPEQIKEFEKKIAEDQEFSEDVSFYLSALRAAKEESVVEKKKRFREILISNNGNQKIRKVEPLRKLWPYLSAAALISGIIIIWFLFMKPASPVGLANNYIRQNLQVLPVKMGVEDKLQSALRLYNEGRLNESLIQFESIIKAGTFSFTALKYAGIVSLRLHSYDKALSYFKQLADHPGLYSNPGDFYQALTLLDRNLPGDLTKAKVLLQEVVKNNLEGQETAKEWLKKL